MSKPFTYWVRLALVATLCTITTFSPVYAGRWMDRLLHRDACKAPVNCCEVISTCESKCAAVPAAPWTVLPMSPCMPAPIACDSAPSEMTSVPKVEMEPAIATPETKLPKVTTPATETPAVLKPAVTSPAIVAPVETAPVIQTPVEPTVNEVAPVVTPVPPKVEPLNPVVEPVPTNLDPVVEPPKTTPTVDDLFGTEPAKPAPAKPAPAKPAPAADDLFGTEPAKPAPAKPAPAADDLFGTEPAKPAPAKPAPAADDLFGTEPAPAKPAPAADDLFGTEPAPARPAPATDDIFGTEPAAEKATKTDPAESEIGDLFKEDAQAKPAPVPEKAEPNLDELFGKPISSTTEEASQSNVNTDDAQFFDKLFSQSRVAKEQPKQDQPATVDTVTLPAESAPDPIETKTTTPAAADSDPDLELDKLFGVGSFNPPPQFDGAEYRQWVDNTGAYAIKARLTVIYSDKIKLTKENGNTTTVSLSRLSDADFGYVQWVASSLTGEQTSMLVKNNAAPNADSTR
ncbi:MAG: SHD1 domain-containing protein [Planctomycetota bacterium]|nr:SHD1 domain-containing protein [Planctomycetota bacterium]